MTTTSGPASRGRALLAGRGSGRALILDEPLSFWGGVDPADGRITDRHHPQSGQSIRGRVLVMPSGRGSSSSSSVLAEAIRAGTGPAAIVLAEPDHIVVLGALVAEDLYGTAVPVVTLDAEGYGSLRSGQEVVVEASGGEASVTAGD